MNLHRVDYVPLPYDSNGMRVLEAGEGSALIAGEPIEEGDGQFDSWAFQEPERWRVPSEGWMATNRSNDMSHTWECKVGALIACPVCRQLDVPKSGVFNAHCIPPIAKAFRKWHRLACEGFCRQPPATDLYCFTCHVVFDQSFIKQTYDLVELYNAIPHHAIDAYKPRICAEFPRTEPYVTWHQCGSLVGDGYAYGSDHDVLLALHSPRIIPASQFASMSHIDGHRSLLYETYHRRQSNGYLSVYGHDRQIESHSSLCF